MQHKTKQIDTNNCVCHFWLAGSQGPLQGGKRPLGVHGIHTWVGGAHASWGTLVEPFMPVTLHLTGGLLVPPDVSYLQLHEFHCCLFCLLNLVFVFRKDIQFFSVCKKQDKTARITTGNRSGPFAFTDSPSCQETGHS